MDLILLESVSTDTSTVTVTVIQPLHNQASLWGSHDEVSVVNAKQDLPAAESVTCPGFFFFEGCFTQGRNIF